MPISEKTGIILNNYQELQGEIRYLLHQANRPLDSCQLLLAGKRQSIDHIEILLKTGHRLFGENYVQEGQEKWPLLKATYPDTQLHLIGPLQSNKAAMALELFDVIETLDRPKLADILLQTQKKLGIARQYFIQVNTGVEMQKSGIRPQDTVAFVHRCRAQGLDVIGLMAIPPASQHPAPHFALLAKLAKESNLKRLSMGMSNDYQIAIQLGSTQLRLGTKIFGSRPDRIRLK